MAPYLVLLQQDPSLSVNYHLLNVVPMLTLPL